MSMKGDPAATAERMRVMPGLELLEAIRDGTLPQAPMAAVLDFRLVEVERGRAVFEGTPRAAFHNIHGMMHGGFAMALIDSCTGFAVCSVMDVGSGYTTIETKVNFTRPVSEGVGPLRAIGTILSAGRRIATAEGRLVGLDGKLSAHGTSTCLVFPL
jgi:uncharacterized protein (TIGR00369 family)